MLVIIIQSHEHQLYNILCILQDEYLAIEIFTFTLTTPSSYLAMGSAIQQPVN